MTKFTSRALGLVSAASLVALTAGGAMAQDKRTIAVSIPAATHGWTGGVVYHAEQAEKEIEAAFPNIDVIVKTSPSATAQVSALRGIPTVIDDERIQGFTDVMKDTNIEILDIQYANWNQDEAFSLMQDYLAKYPHIDAVWANDDDMLLGVLEAVKQSGRTEIKYALGGNGMKDVIEMVKAGDPVTPISTPYPPSMIKSAIYMTAAQFAGQAPMRGNFKLDAPLITPENADQFYFPDSPF